MVVGTSLDPRTHTYVYSMPKTIGPIRPHYTIHARGKNTLRHSSLGRGTFDDKLGIDGFGFGFDFFLYSFLAFVLLRRCWCFDFVVILAFGHLNAVYSRCDLDSFVSSFRYSEFQGGNWVVSVWIHFFFRQLAKFPCIGWLIRLSRQAGLWLWFGKEQESAQQAGLQTHTHIHTRTHTSESFWFFGFFMGSPATHSEHRGYDLSTAGFMIDLDDSFHKGPPTLGRR